MALIFGIANKKGGVGKSSIINLFAITSSNEPIQKKVLVIDASENKLLTYLNAYHQQTKFHFVKAELTDVPSVLAAESENYDVILIDFPANDAELGFKKALICCSNIIIPMGVGIMDQIATKDFLNTTEEIKSLRKAAGYNTLVSVLVSNVANENEGQELLKLLGEQKVPHFEGVLLRNDSIGASIEKGLPVMDYVTEGIGWTKVQEMFHKVYIEFHSLTE